ncbi:MAG: aminoacyl-tRNA hydrolase [Acidobacteria bacterium]|nr:aminoacyl-tRNA hydrolase [Acidobacteriota bacterium]
MASSGPHIQDDGSLFVRSRLVIPEGEIQLRVTTSGGPGGQHANRALTRVVATFDVEGSLTLSESDRSLLVEKIGPIVRSSSSRFRSQSQNRTAALEHLAQKIASALVRQTPRRPSRPTRASKVRRVDEKKARGRVKEQRRRPSED